MDSPSRTLRRAASLSSSEDFPNFNYVSSRSLVNPWNAIHTDHAFNSLIPSVSSTFHSNSAGESCLLPGYSYGDESKPILPPNQLQICTNQNAYASVADQYWCNSDVIHGLFNAGVSTLNSSDEIPPEYSISTIGGSTVRVHTSGNPSCSLNGIQSDFMPELGGPSCFSVPYVQLDSVKGSYERDQNLVCHIEQRNEGTRHNLECSNSDTGSSLSFTSPDKSRLIQDLLDPELTLYGDLISYYASELPPADYSPGQSSQSCQHGKEQNIIMPSSTAEPASIVHNDTWRHRLDFEMAGDGQKGLHFNGSEEIGSCGRQLDLPCTIGQLHISSSSNEPHFPSPLEPLHNGIKMEGKPKRKRPTSRPSRAKKTCQRCKCDKSKCLKLYCACFAAGLHCVEPCACKDCHNKLEHQDKIRQIRVFIKSRNPFAFSPKVIWSSDHMAELMDVQRNSSASLRHKRGCNCKKSSCSRNYCECFQGRVGCSSSCRCEGCKNKFGIKEGESFEFTEIQNNGVQDLGSALQVTTPLLLSRPLTIRDRPSCSSLVDMRTPPSASCDERNLENPSIIISQLEFEDEKLFWESDLEQYSIRPSFRTTSNRKRVSPINCDHPPRV